MEIADSNTVADPKLLLSTSTDSLTLCTFPASSNPTAYPDAIALAAVKLSIVPPGIAAISTNAALPLASAVAAKSDPSVPLATASSLTSNA